MSRGAFFEIDRLAYPAVRRLLQHAGPKIALLPVGSVEAHGPHLPLGTDTFISVAVADRAGLRLAAKGMVCLRFPAIAYGVTDWAAMFAGTTSISAATTAAMVFEACRAIATMGFDRVVITNAHLEPAHIATLRGVAKRFADELGQPLVFPDKTRRHAAARLTEEFRSGSCHAGQYEGSLVLAIHPELVDLPAARRLPAHVVPLHERIAAGARDFVECGLPDAYCGDPAAASRDEGERSLATLTDLVIEAVDASLAAPATNPTT